jgi:hypothetical protein
LGLDGGSEAQHLVGIGTACENGMIERGKNLKKDTEKKTKI